MSIPRGISSPALLMACPMDCERLIPTTNPKVNFNHIKFLGGWCNYLDWCQFMIIKIDTKN